IEGGGDALCIECANRFDHLFNGLSRHKPPCHSGRPPVAPYKRFHLFAVCHLQQSRSHHHSLSSPGFVHFIVSKSDGFSILYFREDRRQQTEDSRITPFVTILCK